MPPKAFVFGERLFVHPLVMSMKAAYSRVLPRIPETGLARSLGSNRTRNRVQHDQDRQASSQTGGQHGPALLTRNAHLPEPVRFHRSDSRRPDCSNYVGIGHT
jgi:hypothetical protein